MPGPRRSTGRGLIDEFAIRIIDAEDAGASVRAPADVPDRADDGYHDVTGSSSPRTASAGSRTDAKGDSGKSSDRAFILGELAKRGIPVALLDYEWEGLPHKRRAAQFWPDGPPPIRYIQCTRPLRDEAESIRRDFLHHGIRYFAIDSVVPACHDKPELSETVTAFNRAARYIAGTQAGQLWLGHVVKSKEIADGDETFFGSVFWGNFIRVGWFVKAATERRRLAHLRLPSSEAQRPAAAPLRRRGRALRDRAHPRRHRCDLAEDAPDLAGSMPLWQRMRDSLKQGPRTIPDLAEELDAKPDAIKKAAQRGTRMFTKLEGGLGIPARLALVDRRQS